MSHRTIIEINHDCLHDYREHPELWQNLFNKLWSNDWSDRWTQDTPGIKKVGERHHSEDVSLIIGSNGCTRTVTW